MPAKGFELKHFLHPWPLHRVAVARRFINQLLSWSYSVKEEQESSRQATQESIAGQTRTTAEKGGGYRVGQRSRPTRRVPYPRRPCLSGIFLVTSSWMGSRTVLPARYFLHDLVTGGTSHNGSRQSIYNETLED